MLVTYGGLVVCLGSVFRHCPKGLASLVRVLCRIAFARFIVLARSIIL